MPEALAFYGEVIVDWVPYAVAVAMAVGGLIGFGLGMLRAISASS